MVFWLVNCTNTKNSVSTRAFHNMTARYNGYYYSNENIKDGVYKIEKSNKDNFTQLLPIYVYPAPEQAKATFAEFDKAIKKSSLVIQRHAIKDSKGSEIAGAGKWIDNNWINVGISHFYKRDFFSGIDVFEYVVRMYPKSDDKYTAMIWLIKSYNEVGSVTNAEQIIALLKNQKNLPQSVKNELPVVWADYYIRRGMYSEAQARLMEVVRNNNLLTGMSKKRRARYAFIVAQLAEQQKDFKRAQTYYEKTIHLKPTYEMMFYSKIRLARLTDVKKYGAEKIRKELLKMTKENKNSDFFDVIYYTLGEISEKENNRQQAIFFYQRSVQTSVNNAIQKALSYLKLGEISFDATQYVKAGSYYDSTMLALPKTYPDYDKISARKQTLERLVKNLNTITKEDSLQRIAKLPEADRMKLIEKIIEKQKEEDERKRLEAQAAKENTGSNSIDLGTTNPNQPGTALFYFYNPTTVAFGITEFSKKWGTRKFEDNWRRSNKASSLEEIAENGENGSNQPQDTAAKKKYSPEKYLKDLPLSDSLIKKSNARIIKAYYNVGSIYKEELANYPRATAAYEELYKRFPNNEYLLNCYYMLYRIGQAEKNAQKEDLYKNKILSEFPESEFALLIQNPERIQQVNASKNEIENFYASTYETYAGGKYPSSYQLAGEGLAKFGKSEYAPKFEFIKAMSKARISGTDSLENDLKLLVGKYPNDAVTPQARDILAAINKLKNGEPKPEKKPEKTDTFSLNKGVPHFIIAVMPNNQKILNAFSNNLTQFNNQFFSNKNLEVSTNLIGTKYQVVIIKQFDDAKAAVNYFSVADTDPTLFSGDAKREDIYFYPINLDNLQVLYRLKNPQGYEIFFAENYLK